MKVMNYKSYQSKIFVENTASHYYYYYYYYYFSTNWHSLKLVFYKESKEMLDILATCKQGLGYCKTP